MIVAQARIRESGDLHVQFVAGFKVNRNYGGAFNIPPEFILNSEVEEPDRLYSLAGSSNKYFRVFLLATDSQLLVFTNADGLIAKIPLDVLEDRIKAYLKGA